MAKKQKEDDIAIGLKLCIMYTLDSNALASFASSITATSSQSLPNPSNTAPVYPDLVVWLNVTWSLLETLTDEEVLAVVARNKKGASDPVLLKDLVFRDAAKRTGEGLDLFCSVDYLLIIIYHGEATVSAFKYVVT